MIVFNDMIYYDDLFVINFYLNYIPLPLLK